MTPTKNGLDRLLGYAAFLAPLLFIGFITLVVFHTFQPPPPPEAVARAQSAQLIAALQRYAREYGAPPTGQAPQALRKLRGENPRRIAFFKATARAYDSQGELLDPWGTPYRFDLSDPQNPRVWSCGKNRRDDGGAEGSDDIPSWR